METREMRLGDVETCARVFADSLNELRRERGLAPREFVGVDGSINHLLSTDPEGAFVAEEAGRVVGFAQAARRENLWLLGKLFVQPAAQGQGAGKRLLDLAVAYGSDLPGGIICSTPDSRALRSYGLLTGFELHPMLTATGIARHERIGKPSAVRAGTTADFVFAAELDREIRGGAHGPDLDYLLGQGSVLLVVDGRGYAVSAASGPSIVAAGDDEAAADLLRACLRRCDDGAEVVIPRIERGHQWALRVALDAGLVVSPGGALVVRYINPAAAAYLPDNVFC